MRYALHAASVMHTNIATDARVVRSAGYDGIELWMPKLARYLDAGFTTDDLQHQLGPVQVTMLDTLMPIDSAQAATQARVREECARMAEVAQRLGCPAIQAVALGSVGPPGWPSHRGRLVTALRELADIATPHGVRLALEPVVFSTFRSLSDALDVVHEVGADRVGLCLDTWHLWTSGTSWDEVAALDPALIVAVQLSDTQPKTGPTWRDEDRCVLPGDGVLPLRLAIDAIRATGYDGYWAVEMQSPHHWEWDPEHLAQVIIDRARILLRPEATGDRASTPRATRG